MPITQYSQISNRRGLFSELQSLPTPLETSELGHATDLRRLFIGNGDIIIDSAPSLGNTEIITDFTLLTNPNALLYTHQGFDQTGVSTATVRSIGSIIDDWVSVKSFGVEGDGVTDDTKNINLALMQCYLKNKTLYFPPAIYAISDSILIPPNSRIEGAGINKSIIVLSNSSNPVCQTVDSMGQLGVQIGTNGAALPKKIEINNIMFQNMGDYDVFWLNRCQDISFNHVFFLGAWTGTGTTSNAVNLNGYGSAITVEHIKFNNCTFAFTYQDVNISSNSPLVNKIYFNTCDFYNSYYGINSTFSCNDIKIANSYFKNITSNAIVASPLASNIKSENNTFDNCGSISNVIVFATNVADSATDCSSINDTFINCTGGLIQNNGKNTVIINNLLPFLYQNLTISPSLPKFILAGNVSNAQTGFQINANFGNTAFIDYTLVRASAVRVGRMQCTIINNTPVICDLFSESTTSGIEFSLDSLGNLLYTDTIGSSTNLTLSIQPQYWNS